jgi:hypothetical protein
MRVKSGRPADVFHLAFFRFGNLNSGEKKKKVMFRECALLKAEHGCF